jgi:hypothetical protein
MRWDFGSSRTEGVAKFSLKVINELKARGVNDILIAVVDGLKGFREAITRSIRDDRTDLHRAPGPQQLGVRVLEGRKAILPSIKAIYQAERPDEMQAGGPIMMLLSGHLRAGPPGVFLVRGQCRVGRLTASIRFRHHAKKHSIHTRCSLGGRRAIVSRIPSRATSGHDPHTPHGLII